MEDILHKLATKHNEEEARGYLANLQIQREEAIEYLINKRNDLRYTPIHSAIFARYYYILLFLILLLFFQF